MLEVYLHDGARSLKFVIAGTLTEAWTQDLEHSWKTASSILNGKELVIDLVHLTAIDDEGIRLLTAMHRQGARLITGSVFSDALGLDISGSTPLLVSAPPMSFFSKLICRYTRCCRRVGTALFLRRKCDSPAQKIW